ncbi:MAG: hypothetical protein EU532_10390 [Promethearchaeota archaeon]|nr:MAG: hypothetical protein EU532_10390 [Candidatus Lokiarchaeota archaeon]
MYKIENIGENCLYIKVLGTMPPSVAKKFVKDFKAKTKNLDNFSSLVDGLDLIILNLKSFKIILKLLKKNNKKLNRAAYIIGKSPVLNKEAEILLEEAKSSKRKIVATLDEAKDWVGIKDIVIQKD